MTRRATTLMAGLLLFALIGCASSAPTSEEVCDRAVELGCTPESMRDGCVAGQEDQLEIHRRWGCEGPSGELSACLIERWDDRCDAGGACDAESNALATCIADAMAAMP